MRAGCSRGTPGGREGASVLLRAGGGQAGAESQKEPRPHLLSPFFLACPSPSLPWLHLPTPQVSLCPCLTRVAPEEGLTVEDPRSGALGTKGALTHPPGLPPCSVLSEARLVGEARCLPRPAAWRTGPACHSSGSAPRVLMGPCSGQHSPLFPPFHSLPFILLSSSCISLPAPLCWEFHAGQLRVLERWGGSLLCSLSE